MRQWIQRLGWGLASLLLALGLGAGAYVWQSFPQREGEASAPGLQAAVKVQRDSADVTHIDAQSPRDAWFSMGYVHAQERGWQLEFNRRVMHGELSELFGEGTLETDKFLRTLGIVAAARQQLAGLSADTRAALAAYADGVNAFHASSSQALPPEFHVFGARPGRWEPADSVGWSLMMALDLGGNWGNEFARLSAGAVVDTPRLWQLFPPYPGEPPAATADLAALYRGLGVYPEGTKIAIKSEAAHIDSTGAGGQFDAKLGVLAQGLGGAAAAWAQDFNASAGVVEGKGSNNWVLAGSRTASGKPLLANDPHLALSAPAIWYFARLKAPGLDVMGATLPGMPFVVLGRTAKVAWGFTNTGPDVQDLYLEQINPNDATQYRTPQGWAVFTTRQESIKVKGRADVPFTVRGTRHGPVISDAFKAHARTIDTRKYALALRWSALDADNRTVEAGFRGNLAQSVAELQAAYADYHSPMQNVVMADTAGAIAYQRVGRDSC